jgi:dTMP kinase
VLIALEGIDGSGKSTIANMIYNKLKPKIPSIQSHHKLSPDFDHLYLRKQMYKLCEILTVPANEQCYLSMFGERYWLFLVAAWFSVVQKNRIEPAKSQHNLMLMDGWYYRFIAKFLYKGNFDRGWLFSLFNTVDDPDLVVMLDIDPKTAWKRRQFFKPNEIGIYERGSAEFSGDDFQLYCTYQSALRETLLQFSKEKSWFVVHQTDQTTKDEACNFICDHILKTFKNHLYPNGIP